MIGVRLPTQSGLFDVIDLVGRHWRSGGLVAVFVCYLDDSDAVHSPVATIAGYAGTIDGWKIFEWHAQEVYARYGVNILHAKDLHHTKGEFLGWGYEKKLQFIDELYRPIGGMLLCGVSVSTNKVMHQRAKKKLRGYSNASAYGRAFTGIVSRLILYNQASLLIREAGISFVVEASPRNNEIQEHFHLMSKTGGLYAGIARSLVFVDKTSSKAIHLADVFAFHSRRFRTIISKNGGKATVPTNSEIYNRMRHYIHHDLVNTTGQKTYIFKRGTYYIPELHYTGPPRKK